MSVTSTAAQAYAHLESMIVTLELPPGSLTTEAALNERLRLGRTPVREAVSRLAWEGLIEIRPRAGLAVAGMEPAGWLHLLETMAPLKVQFARAAAEWHIGAHAAGLRAASLALQKAMITGNVIAYLDAGKAAETAMARASGNVFLARALAPLQIHGRRYWYRYQNDSGLGDAAMQRLRILAAVLEGDADSAERQAYALNDLLKGYAVGLIRR